MTTLIAIPVYNEQAYVDRVLDLVRWHGRGCDILVVDDGSTDNTPMHLARQPVDVVRHASNRGYGRSLRDAFRWAECYGYDWLITMDCDEQHEPESLPDFFAEINRGEADVISGSRYLQTGSNDDQPPAERREVNRIVTDWVNQQLGLSITDAFCGYKAYHVGALNKLKLDVSGYALPLQFWVQAAAHGLTVREVPIRLIYRDPNRAFGGALDDRDHRLALYREVFEAELAKFPETFNSPCQCDQ